jgi:RES domain-containing protein
MLVHIDRTDVPASYKLLAIDVPDDAPQRAIAEEDLPEGWRGDLAATQALGLAWIAAAEALTLTVPSALVPHAVNVLVNPAHPDAARCTIAEAASAVLDARLAR